MALVCSHVMSKFWPDIFAPTEHRHRHTHRHTKVSRVSREGGEERAQVRDRGPGTWYLVLFSADLPIFIIAADPGTLPGNLCAKSI